MISVVTLTHNQLACTRRCLPSLLGTRGADWELIVVDNGSADGTAAWLRGFREQAGAAGVPLTLIENPGNTGCAKARNQGAAAAAGDFIVFVDNDVGLRCRHWLRDLAGWLRAAPERGIVGPKLVYPYPPHNIQCAGVGVSPSGRVQFRGRGAARTDPRFNRETEVQCLISACFMIEADAFREAGGFDTAFDPVEYEDLDLCYRVREAGRTAGYLPGVEMYHFESVTTTGTPRLPNTYLIIKHGLLFKRRWRHRFAVEGGPAEADTRWLRIPSRPLDSIPEPEVV